MKRIIFTLTVVLFSYLATQAQEKKVVSKTPAEVAPKVFIPHHEWNYAEAYRSGNLVYISGVPASGPMDQALDNVYRTLQATLKQYNLDFTHVIKENLYTTNMEEMAKHHLVRKQFYGTHTPAATWVQIERLLMPNAVLEVELIAEIKKTK